MGIGAVMGLVLGLIAAIKHDTIWDSLATVISVIGVSVPSYVFALALSYSLGFKRNGSPCFTVQRRPSVQRSAQCGVVHVYHGVDCQVYSK